MAETSSINSSAHRSFQDEFLACWRVLPDKALFFGLLAIWLALFHFLGNSTFGYVDSPSLFVWIQRICLRPDSDDSHVTLVPLIVLGLFWWKREVLLGVGKTTWWPALFLLMGAAVLHVLGHTIQQPKVSILACWAGIYALIALVWGYRFAAACFFPFVLLLFCIPISSFADPITVPLRAISTKLAVITSHALGIPVLQDGVQILDPKGRYSYEVAAACSGIRSLFTLVALCTIYGWVTFTTGWKRLFMVGLAVPIALLGNLLRLVCIIIAAEAFGEKAGHFVHEWFGFLTFALAMVIVIACGHWLRDSPAHSGPAPQPGLA